MASGLARERTGHSEEHQPVQVWGMMRNIAGGLGVSCVLS
jgi:hypothetical protein